MKQRRLGAGGPAAAGGYNYQAAVTAIAMAYALRGAPLGWLEGLVEDAPLSVAAETGGVGDDLRLTLSKNEQVEIQIKRRLRTADGNLWNSLLKLASGVARDEIAYGVLVVGPFSSRAVSFVLAADLIRLGEDGDHKLSDLGVELARRLREKGLEPRTVASRLRLVTVAAHQGSDGDVKAARAELGHLCADPSYAGRAWDRLYRDAAAMMEHRGVRSRAAMTHVLRSAGIPLRANAGGTPAELLEQVCGWTINTNNSFTILGVESPLPIQTAWIPLTAVVDAEADAIGLQEIPAAIDRYHSWGERNRSREEATSDPEALGRFYRHSVVVAGPGMGKSTLLSRLARAYASDGFAVLKVSALAVARRMTASGAGFWESALALGLDGSGISPHVAEAGGFSDWVLLLDGLDEAASNQHLIVEGARQFIHGYPQARVIITTRPVGYRRAGLATWRHYTLPSFGRDDAPRHIGSLLEAILPRDDPRRPHLTTVAAEALKRSDAGRTAGRSPLLLGLSAALIARGETLGRTRAGFYRRIFNLIEQSPPPRVGAPPATPTLLRRFLDLLGWTLIDRPASSLEAALEFCGRTLAEELDRSALQGRDLAEACLTYWEALGVVERLHGTSDAAVTFVHKTFGEYAAGRRLSVLSEEEQWEVLRARGDLDRWREPIAFAAALGKGAVFIDALLNQGFAGLEGQERLLRALEIVYEHEPPLDERRTVQVLDAALVRAGEDHRTWALEVGHPLVAIAARYPQLVNGRGLLSHPQPWTRLVGWTSALEAEPGAFTVEALIAGLDSILADNAALELRRGGFPSGAADRDLLQDFAIRIAEIVLERREQSEADQIINGLFHRSGFGTVGMAIRLESLLEPWGIKLRWRDEADARAMEAFSFSGPDASLQRAAFTGLLMPLLPMAEQTEAAIQAPNRILYALGGFFALLNLAQASLLEIWPFRNWGDAIDVSEVSIARIGQLQLDQLADEARELIDAIATGGGEAFTLIFRRVPTVDIPPADWKLVKSIMIDLDRIEAALRRASTLVIEPATNLALNTGDASDWKRIAERLLASGSGDTLWAAAKFADALPRKEGLDLLFARAVGPPVDGLAHIFRALTLIAPEDDRRCLKALRAALLAEDPHTAIAAAEWVAACAPSGSEDLLSSAVAHWRVTEKPYPEGGGSVPPSPRAELLKAFFKLKPPSISDLRSILADKRHDVCEVATSELLKRLDAADERTMIIDMILAGVFGIELARKILAKVDQFDGGDLPRLIPLLGASNTEMRLAAIPLLRSSHFAANARAAILAKLRSDSHPTLREAAEAELERGEAAA